MKGQRGQEVRFLSFRSENLCHRQIRHYGQNRLVLRENLFASRKIFVCLSKIWNKNFCFRVETFFISKIFSFRVETFSILKIFCFRVETFLVFRPWENGEFPYCDYEK